MKVILNKDIPNLGEEGEIKNVARGYARNYLIPQSLVMPYTPEALSILESRREQLELRREEKQKAAMDIKTRLESENLVIDMPAGDRGRLFGSVTSATIVDALAANGISIERKRLEMPEKTIKSVGTTRVRVRLYGDEEAELKVVVRATGTAEAASPEAAAEGSVSEAPAASAPASPAADESAPAEPAAADPGDTVESADAPADAAEDETEVAERDVE